MHGTARPRCSVADVEEYRAFAWQHGQEISKRAAETRVRTSRGLRQAMDDLREAISYAEDSAALGHPVDYGTARQMLQGGGEQALARYRAKAARRTARRGPCRRRGSLPGDRVARTNALAGCGCGQRCETPLVLDVDPFLRKAVMEHRGRIEFEDAMQEARAVVPEALDTWPMEDGRPFVNWLGKHIRTRLYDLRREQATVKRGGGTVTLSLSNPIVGTGNRGEVVTLAESIPDRTVDVSAVVEMRERIREAVQAARDRVASAGEAFDARVAAGVVA